MVSFADSRTFDLKSTTRAKRKKMLDLSENYGIMYEGRLLPSFLL